MWNLARFRTSSFFAFSFAGAIEVAQLSVSATSFVDAFAAYIGFLASYVVARKLEVTVDPDLPRD